MSCHSKVCKYYVNECPLQLFWRRQTEPLLVIARKCLQRNVAQQIVGLLVPNVVRPRALRLAISWNQTQTQIQTQKQTQTHTQLTKTTPPHPIWRFRKFIGRSHLLIWPWPGGGGARPKWRWGRRKWRWVRAPQVRVRPQAMAK